ncbi:MAG: tetraacyldisaccharide 4'-kinase [Phycisphaeraceae bacterium]|nr:tetraacyldisaccharide 4'-kinase [Phycisphaerales bacterium]MCB9859085.1 tetraacyldisaccharide 4'-kinase [Phycisphaeraceae bacterium]
MTSIDGRGQSNNASVVEHRGPVPAFLGSVLKPLYTIGIARANKKFDRGIGVETLDIPVFSVGNLTVGGTGKTPMVIYLVRELQRLDIRPCIAMRGYGATPGMPSDEQDEYTRALPEVPVIAQPDRINGIRHLLASERGQDIDCVVLDDGFQHRQIARDCDIVLIDASKPIHRDSLLPKGWMREPISSLKRADVIIMTRVQDAVELDEAFGAVRQHAPDVTPVRASNTWTECIVNENNTDMARPVSWLSDKSVFVVAGIGNPSSFLRQCEQHTTSIAGSMMLRDHNPYENATVLQLIDCAAKSSADCILTTDKDWSKLRHVQSSRWPCPVVRPIVGMQLDNPGVLTQHILSVFERARAATKPLSG